MRTPFSGTVPVLRESAFRAGKIDRQSLSRSPKLDAISRRRGADELSRILADEGAPELHCRRELEVPMRAPSDQGHAHAASRAGDDELHCSDFPRRRGSHDMSLDALQLAVSKTLHGVGISVSRVGALAQEHVVPAFLVNEMSLTRACQDKSHLIAGEAGLQRATISWLCNSLLDFDPVGLRLGVRAHAAVRNGNDKINFAHDAGVSCGNETLYHSGTGTLPGQSP